MNKDILPEKQMNQIIEIALEEDTGRGDVTSETLIPCELQGKGYLLIKEDGILAGIDIARKVFHKVDPSLEIDVVIRDGSEIKTGDVALRVSGNLRSLLKAERVVLNFVQRLSGIASTTQLYAAKVRGLGVDIADTRKTTPGMRALEKYAVRMGGGRNHRMDLSDAVLIKDNHFTALKALGMTYSEIIIKARQNIQADLKIEAEASTVQEAVEAAEAGADIVMLDNMPIEQMSEAVGRIAGRAEVEASGGFTLDTVRAAAETGVDFISIGALTHSYRSLDISLEIEPGYPALL